MSNQIRKPGEEFDLTDEELIVSPARMLSPEQRKRRRKLKHDKRVAAGHERRRHTKERSDRCQGITRAGNPCGSFSVLGAKHCMAHLNEAEKSKLGLKSLAEIGREARRVMPSESQKNNTPLATMRQIAETAAEKIIARQFAPLGMEFKGYDEEGKPVIIDHGAEKGIVLHGVSKDGDVVISRHADLASQFNIAEKLWDRLYGKPRQTTVIEGGKNPVQVQPVHDPERAQKVARMLHQVGAIPRDPHEGRRRSQPSEQSSTEEPGKDQSSSNVTPLRSDT